jgi:hypothetical protein
MGTLVGVMGQETGEPGINHSGKVGAMLILRATQDGLLPEKT